MAASSGLFLATIYNQSQLAERKHVARYWSINTATKAVPLSAHPSPLVITTKLAAAIFGGALYGGVALPAQYYTCDHDCVSVVRVQLRSWYNTSSYTIPPPTQRTSTTSYLLIGHSSSLPLKSLHSCCHGLTTRHTQTRCATMVFF